MHINHLPCPRLPPPSLRSVGCPRPCGRLYLFLLLPYDIGPSGTRSRAHAVCWRLAASFCQSLLGLAPHLLGLGLGLGPMNHRCHRHILAQATGPVQVRMGVVEVAELLKTVITSVPFPVQAAVPRV